MDKDQIFEINNRVFTTGNLDDYAKPFNDERDKYIKDYVFEDGVECAVYYPPNITEDTKIVTYYPGGGNKNDWYHKYVGGRTCIQDYLGDGNCNQIVLMPLDNRGIYRERQVIASKVAMHLQDKYNLNSDSVAWGGWSFGGPSCLESPVVYQTLNPKAKSPQITCVIDGYNIFNENPAYELKLLGDDYKNNNNVLISLENRWRSGPDRHNFLDQYAKSGINVIKAVYTGDGSYEKETDNGRVEGGKDIHFAINGDYFRRGIMDFTAGGTSKLPEKDFLYYVWNKENESWEEINVHEIDTYSKLMGHFGLDGGSTTTTDDFSSINNRFNNLKNLKDIVIKSDEQSVAEGLNDIRHTVKNSSCVQQGLTSISCSSTTQVPSAISNVIAGYFATTTSLLELVANQTETFVSVYNSINNLDEELEDGTENLDDTTTPNDTTNTTPNDTTNTTPNDTTNTTPNDTTNATPNDTTNTTPNDTTNTTPNDTTNTTPNDTTNTTPNDTTTPPSYQPSTGGGGGGGGGSGTPSGSDTPSFEEQNNDKVVVENIEFPFIDYDNLKSSLDKVVLNYTDNCRIVLHSKDNKLIGIEHYYKLQDGQDPNKIYNVLRRKYSSNLVQSIDIKDNCIRVNFKTNAISNISYDKIKTKYNNLKIV